MIDPGFMAVAIVCSFIIGGAGFLLAGVALGQLRDLRKEMRRIQIAEERGYGRHSKGHTKR